MFALGFFFFFFNNFVSYLNLCHLYINKRLWWGLISISFLVGHQEWYPTEKDIMARWSTWDQLPNPTKLKLDIQISNQGSDWNLHVLPFH